MNLKYLSYQKNGVFAPNNPTLPNLSPNMQKNALLPFYSTYNDLPNKSKNCECECVYQSKSFKAALSNSDAGSMLIKCDDLGI
jgi:hypothetical protein